MWQLAYAARVVKAFAYRLSIILLLAVAVSASGQSPSRTIDLTKKSPYDGKMFSSKGFETKTYTTKEYETKIAPTKGFATKTNENASRTFETSNFKPQTSDHVSWWQRLFASRNADANGKSYATTNAVTRTDPLLQEKLSKIEKSKTVDLPTIKATPEEINRLR